MYLDSDDKIAAQEMMARNMTIAIALELGNARDIRKFLNKKGSSFLYFEEPLNWALRF
jgi:hypothetical protein